VKKQIFLTFLLHVCSKWQDKEDFFKLAQLVKHKGDLLPYSNQRISLIPPGSTRLITHDRNLYFDQRYRENDSWDDTSFEWHRYKENIGIPFRTTLFPEWNTEEPIQDILVDITLHGRGFGKKYNRIEISSSLFSKWYEKISVQDILDTFFQFAQPAIEMMRPNYGVMTVDQEVLVPYGREVLDGKLETIFWWNYFGPIYLEKYGESIFLDAPGYRVERVGEGIWYQLTKQFQRPLDAELEKNILAHFKSIGVKRINPFQ
jgi:hypothetical protein